MHYFTLDQGDCMATTKPAETSGKKTTSVKKASPAAAKDTKSATPRKKPIKPSIITSEERYKMIEVAAYYVAEKNGFGGQPMDYWLEAERQIEDKLNA
jgi:hypothetical protein